MKEECMGENSCSLDLISETNVGLPQSDWEKEFDYRLNFDFEKSSTPEVSFLDFTCSYPESPYEYDMDKVKDFIRHHINLVHLEYKEEIDKLKDEISKLKYENSRLYKQHSWN